MIDFPASPTTGQIFTAAGASWRYDGTKWVAYGGGSSGDVGRNLIHNSLFNISQRAGPFTTAGAYTADRWMMDLGLDTLSVTTGAISDSNRTAIGDEAATRYLQAGVTGNAAAGSYSILEQKIEGVQRLGGKTVTISFWAAASVSMNVGIGLAQNFGTGGSPSAQVTGTAIRVTVGTTFARYSVTVNLPSTIGKVIGTNGNDCTILLLWLSSGSTNNALAGSVGVQSGTIQFWGVQLEIGSTATPLEKPDPQQDLARCQRFYCTSATYWQGYGIAGTAAGIYGSLPGTMRAVPTITVTGTGGNVNVGTVTPSSFGLSSAIFFALVTATGNTTLQISYTASADL